uniref:Peptidase metallopeptidase domain-containing protein n=1 Tax=Arion vulgaris TaxID=1028688 RepID=A0A0B6Z285_9EUPU
MKHSDKGVNNVLAEPDTVTLEKLTMVPASSQCSNDQHREDSWWQNSQLSCQHNQQSCNIPTVYPSTICYTSSLLHQTQFEVCTFGDAAETVHDISDSSFIESDHGNISDTNLSNIIMCPEVAVHCGSTCRHARSTYSKTNGAMVLRGSILARYSHLPVLIACLIVLVGYCESRSLNDADKRYREMHTSAVKYLAMFGYLKGPSRETQNLRSQEDLTRAIKGLQRAGGIPQTGVLDVRTETLMTKPRCGNTDDFLDDVKVASENEEDGFKFRRKRYTVATSKWQHTNITFRFVNYTPDMPQAKTRQIISDALKVWSAATPLSFTEVRDSNADMMVMFASQYHSDGYPFDGKGMVLGHAFFPGPGKGGDTHFDDDENWTTNSSDGVDLFMVAAHEFGHALGLAHSGDPSSLMYPWYMGFEGKFQLPEDDFRGITSLYGSSEKDRNFDVKVNLIPNSSNPTYRPNTPDIEPTKTFTNEADTNPADPCNSPIDAITVIRTEIFIFIGKWFWRLDSRKVITKPVEIHQFWYGLPKHLSKIDAVFERPDNKIVFFSGDRYWVFNANHLINGFPSEGRPITEFNIPADVKSINAAFVWGYNKRTYLVSGDMYWKMNVNNTFVEYDYPRDLGTWKGVPVPVDAAFKDLTGKTIFFQGLDFWEFYDMRMRVTNGYPKRISQHWLNCGGVAQRVEQINGSDIMDRTKDDSENHDSEENSNRGSNGTNSCLLCPFSVLVLTVVLLVSKFMTKTCA